MNIINLPTYCSLLLTEQCNFRCKYCFEKHKDNWMNKDIAIKSIDWLFQNANIMKKNSIDITMFGGEPLLNWKIMQTIFEHGVKQSEKLGIKINCSIITNGSIMNDKIYDMLMYYKNKVNLFIQLSIDGIPEVQNMYRITKNNKPSWDLIKNNIPKFIELFKDNPNSLCAHGCINKDSMPYIYENYKFFKKLGIENIWFLPVCEENWDDNDCLLYDKQMNQIYLDIIKKINKSKDIIDARQFSPLDKGLNSICMGNKTCGAGVDYVSINTKGDVYPCHHFYFNDNENETLIGNIYTGLDDMKRNIFIKYDAKTDIIGCESCDHAYCYRCIANNYFKNGSMFIQTRDIYCKMMKIDKKYQEMLKKELTNMGLLKKQNDDLNNCNMHTENINCDIVNGKDDTIEVFSSALHIIIDKLNNIENKLEKR